MPHSLPAIIQHIRDAGRPNSHGAILLREIERLRAEVAELKEDLDAASAWLGDVLRTEPTKETTDV